MSGEQVLQAVMGGAILTAAAASAVFPRALYWYLDRTSKRAAEHFAQLGLTAGIRNYESHRRILRTVAPVVLFLIGMAFMLGAFGVIGD